MFFFYFFADFCSPQICITPFQVLGGGEGGGQQQSLLGAALGCLTTVLTYSRAETTSTLQAGQNQTDPCLVQLHFSFFTTSKCR